MNTLHAPLAKAPRGKGARTKKQKARRRAAVVTAEAFNTASPPPPLLVGNRMNGVADR